MLYTSIQHDYKLVYNMTTKQYTKDNKLEYKKTTNKYATGQQSSRKQENKLADNKPITRRSS